jgi:hypothetical protein
MTHENPSFLLQEQLRENLPDVIRRVVADYGAFAQQNAPTEAKNFDQHHKACKTAVAHLLALSKLTATFKADKAAMGNEMETLLRETRQLLAGNHDGDDEGHEEDQF